ncbi:MAG: type IV secretion system DNA-binding domain-containing protein [Myxococcaceae bacterium]
MDNVSFQSTRSQNAVRGTESVLNEFKMALSALRIWSFVGIWATILVFSFLSAQFTTPVEKDALVCLIKSRFPSINGNISCKVNGQFETFKLKTALELSRPYYTSFFERSKILGSLSSLAFFFTLAGFWYFTRRRGKHLVTDTHVRGAKRILESELRETVLASGMGSDLSLGGVPLLKGRETEHMVISGATGAGKSVAMKELMDTVRRREQPAVVYDTSGEFVSQYYREGIDIILNPFDARSHSWSIWSEIREPFDYDTLASNLIPGSQGDDVFWSTAARTLFSSIARRLYQEKMHEDGQLFYYANTAQLGELHKFLHGTPGAALMDPASEKTAASIRATLANAIRMWPYLGSTKEKKLFSIRNFIENETGADAWLFITCRADQHALLKPLLSCWIAQAVTATLSLSENRDRKIWFFLDELASLQRIAISDLLERGRKYGAACVIGFQALSQLRTIYGADGASTILQNCKTGLFLQAVDAETAKAVSQACGNEEILETGESQSLGLDDHRNGVNLSRRRVVRPTVMDSEFLRMPKLTGILRLPDDYAVTKITLKPKDRPILAPEFVSVGKSPC